MRKKKITLVESIERENRLLDLNIHFIKENYNILSPSAIADKLGISTTIVNNLAEGMGFKNSHIPNKKLIRSSYKFKSV